MESVYAALMIPIALFMLCVMFIRKIMHTPNNQTSHEGIKTLIVCNEVECIVAINELMRHSPQMVGFDLEWKSNKDSHDHTRESKVSLMQLAFSNHLIILIRLHLLQRIPMELISFLHDVTILKCGVGIYGDKRKLYSDYRIDVFGCVDLNDIYLSVNANHDCYFGLERFSNCVLHKEMKYKRGMDHSKWECDALCKTQIDYAANDALVAYEIFMSICVPQTDILQFCFGKIDTDLLSKKAFAKMNKRKHKKKKKNKISANVYTSKSVECICNNKMALVSATECIKNKACRVQKTSKYVVCNRCYQAQKQKAIKVYQCTQQKSIFCENGYFLCVTCALKPKDAHYEYRILDKDGDLLHCCSLRMFTLFRASKNWVQRLDRFTIQMNVDVDAINVNHCEENYFRHIAWITATACYVCNDDKNEIFPFKIIPKWFANHVLGYRVPLCAGCRSKYSKQVIVWCHAFCEKYLMERDAKYQLIYDRKKVKKYCECLQYKHKRSELDVCIQNEYVTKIFEFYYQHYPYAHDGYVEIESVMIKECEFNLEIGIDWYLNKTDYKSSVIRNVLHTICQTFCRRQHDEYMKQILNQHFKDNPLQFTEWLRAHFMRYMKPLNYNHKYPAFEVMYCGDEHNDLLFDPNEEKFKLRR